MSANSPMFTKPTSRRNLLRAGGAAAALMGAQSLCRPWVARAAARKTIAFVPKSLAILVFNYGHWGAEARARELGDVDIVWTGPTSEDASKQAEIISGLTSRHVDGIAISAVAAQPLVQPINTAVDQGIIVTGWDSDVPDSKRRLFYGVDALEMGHILGERTAKLIDGKGLVVLESGSPGATDQNTRLKGVAEIFAKYPDIKTVGPFFHKDDLVQAQQLTDNLLLSHQDAAALLMVAGTPLFGKMEGMPQLLKNKGKIKVIATDDAPTQLPFVKGGYVQVLVGQDYWGWGYQTVSIIYNLLTQSGCQYPKFVPQAMPVIDESNVDEWISKWDQAKDSVTAGKVFKEDPIGCM